VNKERLQQRVREQTAQRLLSELAAGERHGRAPGRWEGSSMIARGGELS
jgi:hypothetical protein